jgi:hypothetical protein
MITVERITSMVKTRIERSWLPFISFLFLAMGTLVGLALMTSVIASYIPETLRAQIGFVLTISMLVILGFYIARFLWFVRQAGSVVAEVPATQYKVYTFLGCFIFVLWISIFAPSFLLTGATNGTGLVIASQMTLLLISGLGSVQVRKNGLVVRGNYVVLSNIDSLEWKNVNYHDRLQVRLKQSKDMVEFPVPPDSRYTVGDYLKQKYPHFFK